MRRQTDWSVVGGIAFAPFLEDGDDVSCSPLLWYSGLVNALLEDDGQWVRQLYRQFFLVNWDVSSLPQVLCLFSGLIVSSGPKRLLS